MPYTIAIDAGHGGYDPGAVYGDRREKDDNLRLALEVGRILENDGFNVIYTRTDDVYDAPFTKATKANNANADFFISFHRNSNQTPNSSSGIETLVYDDSGVKAEVARNINQNLATLGFQNRGVIERPGLVVLRRTQMPAVLVETGFINNDSDNVMFDSMFNEIASAIAAGVSGTLAPGENIPSEPPVPSPATLYKVQVGAFENRDNAYNLSTRLDNDGFPSYVTLNNGLYRVYVGAYEVLANAVNTEKLLRRAGYQTFITTS